jgi:hypothetical protein
MDWRLHCVVISPHYEDGTDTGTSAAEMNAIREKMDYNQERIEAKIGAEIKTIQ